MKKKFGVLALITFWIVLIFLLMGTSSANTQEIKTIKTKEFVKIEVLEVVDKQEVQVSTINAIKKPKFSVSIGMGNGYDAIDKELGELDYNNSSVFSTRIGYSSWKYTEIIGEYSKINFVNEKRYTYWKTQAKLSMVSLTINLKIGLPIITKGVFWKPYIITGVGAAKSKESYYRKHLISGYERNNSYSSSGGCTRTGLGIEVRLHKNLFLFYENSRWSVQSSPVKKVYTTYYSQSLMGASWKF